MPCDASGSSRLDDARKNHVLECIERDDGLRQITMQLGDDSFPVLLGCDKLPQLVAELRKLDYDQAPASSPFGSPVASLLMRVVARRSFSGTTTTRSSTAHRSSRPSWRRRACTSSVT